ncbi:hypothetical protein MRX96_010890 [Rhipicephalus microplus]
MAKAASSPLLIYGDINAPHTQWEHRADSPKDTGAITWSNTFEDLRSDHRVLCITMSEDKGKMESWTGTSVESKENERSRKGRSRIPGNGAGNYSRT